jgi:HEAT repeat protein
MVRLALVPLALLLAVTALLAAPPGPPPGILFDEANLRRAGVPVDPAGLTRLLERHVPQSVDAAVVEALVLRLGDGDFDTREQAAGKLIDLGLGVGPRLRQLLAHTDPEVRRQARICLAEIETRLDPELAAAAGRVLLQQRATGAAAAVLAYLPRAEPEAALDLLAGLQYVRTDAPGELSALRAALEDGEPVRRAAAALTLGRLGTARDRGRVVARLADSSPLVRLRAAQGLLGRRDAAGLPTLAALLSDGPIEIAWQAEELLRWNAGAAEEPAPAAMVGTGAAAVREKCRTDWQEWLSRQTARLDWKRLEQGQRRPGLLLLCEGNNVVLTGCDGATRWIVSAPAVQDAHLLPGGHLLMVTGESLIQETKADGKVIWKQPIPGDSFPRACQSLPGGNVFLVADDYILEADREGRTLFQHQNRAGENYDGIRLRNGQILCLHDNGLDRIDSRTGAVLQHVEVPEDLLNGRPVLNLLPGERLLASTFRGGKDRIFVLNGAGTVLSRLPSPAPPRSTLPLGNGNILVAALVRNQQVILEVTPEGRTVWEAVRKGRIVRMRPCLDEVRVALDDPRPADFHVDTVAYRALELGSSDAAVRLRGAAALADLGENAAGAAEPLTELLHDPIETIRLTAAGALGKIGKPAVPVLVRVLDKGDLQQRAGCLDVLAGLDAGARPALPAALALTRDPAGAEDLRWRAVRVLGAADPGNTDVVAALLQSLRDKSALVREAAARSLARHPRASAPVIDALAGALKDYSGPVILAALAALGQQGERGRPAAPAVTELLRDVRPETSVMRTAALATLAQTGADPATVLPLVHQAIASPKETTALRIGAVAAGFKIEPNGKTTLVVLSDVLVQKDLPSDLAELLFNQLAERREAPPLLGRALQEGSLSTRQIVLRRLPRLGKDRCADLVPLLNEAAKDRDPAIRELANRALRTIEAAPPGKR